MEIQPEAQLEVQPEVRLALVPLAPEAGQIKAGQVVALAGGVDRP